MENQNPFGEGFVEATAGSFIKWTEVGQQVKGVCTDIYERENSLKDNEMQTIVVLETEEGETFQVALKDSSMKMACKKLVVGQQVAFMFAEEIPSKTKGHQSFKLIKTYLGQLDPTIADKHATDVEELFKD